MCGEGWEDGRSAVGLVRDEGGSVDCGGGRVELSDAGAVVVEG